MRFQINRQASNAALRGKRSAGFTLIEFLVAMAMFTLVGGSVLAMFANQAPYFNRQQNLAGLNIALQNAVSELQLNLVNAGTGYYPGTVIPSWPIGVTIVNQPAGAPACNNSSTFTYTSACFDTLNILTLNPNIPPAHPTDPSGNGNGTNCSYLGTSPFYIQASPGLTLAQTAANFKNGDQVLVVTSGAAGSTHTTLSTTGDSSTLASSGIEVNTFVLTGQPTVSTNYVSLPFAPFATPATLTNPYMNDPLNISISDSTNLGAYFCGGDWLMKLEPTTYKVDVTNAQDPKLTRVQGGNTDVIAEQIIGFKVGAATWAPNIANPALSDDTMTYSFYAKSAAPAGYGNDFEQVRSVRVTMIGRTTPNPDPTYTFRNTFDGGPYQVQGATVVINPRNITMNNQ